MIHPALIPIPYKDRGVSFVVPVYNKENYLRDVLGQIKAQKGEFAREYIFVDDGSKDNSLALLREITADWENCHIIEQENAGSAAATNRGIMAATLPYIKFIDADDLLATNATETLLKAIEAKEGTCLAYAMPVTYEDINDIDLEQDFDGAVAERVENVLQRTMYNSLFNPTQFLVRTEAAQKVGGCDESIVYSQEYTLTMRLARHWPYFLRLDIPIAYLPSEVEGRLSNNHARQLQRVTHSVAAFIEQHDGLPWSLRQLACRRAAYRAWKYLHRTDRPFWLTSSVFWRQARCYIPILSDHGAFVRSCGDVYEKSDKDVQLKSAQVKK